MKKELMMFLVLLLIALSAGCSSLSISAKSEEGWGRQSTWDSDQYRNPGWTRMYGY